ncbi:MAG: extracellular solute-binding protein [Clostridia bacterium]|nr:extracellular solute-binding protein [Clostridia bacterium]
MKRKFKFLCLILSLVFALSLGITACKGGASPTSTPSNPPATSSPSSQAPAQSSSSQEVIQPSSQAPASSASNEGDDDDDDVSGGDVSGKTNIKFWYSGEDAEQNVFTSLVSTFNSTIGAQNNINVVATPVANVDEAIGNRFLTQSCPDVFYVGDGSYKKYVEAGYLLDLTNYIENSTVANPDNMWDSIYDRYYYSTTNHRGGDNADENGAWYGLPKDIGPTVIYYNETMFKNAGVTIISVAEENLEDFNLDSEVLDDRGNNKASYGIEDDVPAKGYFISGGKKYFNNQIAMSWDEVRELAAVISASASTETSTVYGYHTEWWFAYGWSVGGDCIEYIDGQDVNVYDGGGFYDFTLVDDTKNYMANETVTVNGTQYAAGEIVSYNDKLQNEAALAGKNNKHATAVYASEITNNPSKFTQLPSQREAFVEFVLLSTDTDVVIEGKNGYNICPKPTSLGGDGAKTTTFKNKQLGMLVDGRWNVTDFRDTVTFEWDVAPLPVYKVYNTDGTVKAKGLESGHSGSVALSINKVTPNPDAAWLFVEFLAGEVGQRQQSLAGFAIPSQVELASNPNNNGFCADGVTPRGVFINQRADDGTLLRPWNAKIFLNAAANEHEGDWAYTKTGSAWIDGWAGLLNGDVRNGKMSFEAFINDTVFMATYTSLKDLTLKK